MKKACRRPMSTERQQPASSKLKKVMETAARRRGERVYEWKGGDATERKGRETDGEPYLIPAKPGGCMQSEKRATRVKEV